MTFVNVDPKKLDVNFFKLIDDQWMLITAGDENKLNTMTASWGGTGVLWHKNVTFAFIRESRYTLEFLDSNDYYTLSFFGNKMMKELSYCGSHSGRDVDKVKDTGLVPVYGDKAPYFEQAELVVVCRKLYRQKIDENCILDKDIIGKSYPNGDWHYTFIGEIVKVLKKV